MKAQNLDQRILQNINPVATRSSNAFYFSLSESADYVAIATPVSLLGAGLLSKDKALTRKGVVSAIAVLGTYGVGYALKESIKRPRPYETTLFEGKAYRQEEGYSFPSGSTSVAFAAATSLVYAKPKWYVAVPAYTFAAGVGYSRMRLAAHYPSDVLAGAVIGSASVWVSHKLTNLINKKSK